MSGSLPSRAGENVPVIPSACATPKYTYLARGPGHYACRGLFNCDGLNVIYAWASNYIQYKLWNEIKYQFQTLLVQPLKFGNG